MKNKLTNILNDLKKDINQLLGFHEETPRINFGPCAVFAKLFSEEWNRRFQEKTHICFIMTRDREECWHTLVRLPSGELYDGGVGIHMDEFWTSEYLIDDMLIYDQALLEKWSYGLERTYPRFCPDFDKTAVLKIIEHHLDRLTRVMANTK